MKGKGHKNGKNMKTNAGVSGSASMQRTDATGDGDGDGAAVGSGRIKPMATTRAFPRYEPYGAGAGTQLQHGGKERQHLEMDSDDEDDDAMYYHTMEMFKSSYRSI